MTVLYPVSVLCLTPVFRDIYFSTSSITVSSSSCWRVKKSSSENSARSTSLSRALEPSRRRTSTSARTLVACTSASHPVVRTSTTSRRRCWRRRPRSWMPRSSLSRRRKRTMTKAPAINRLTTYDVWGLTADVSGVMQWDPQKTAKTIPSYFFHLPSSISSLSWMQPAHGHRPSFICLFLDQIIVQFLAQAT